MRWNRFAVAYARALHGSGAPTPTIEENVARVLTARGMPATIMATPTALWLETDGRARVVRLQPPDAPDLGRQVALHRLADEVVDGLDEASALASLKRVERESGPWSPAVLQAAFVTTAGSTAILFGGTANDVVAAAVLAAVVSAVAGVRHPLAPFLAALAAGVGARLGTAVGVADTITAIAALIVLAPGMTMTTSAAELAAGHLASGTSRFASAVVSLVQLAAGLALAQVVPASEPVVAPVPLPPMTALVVPVAAAMIGVLHRVRPIDLPWGVLITGVAWVVAQSVPGLVGVGLAAAAATILSNALGGWLRTPPAVYSVPGITLLVPGSMGMRGMGELLGDHLVDGLATAFDAATIAMALAAGTLVAQGVIRPRRERRPEDDRLGAAGSCR